MSVAVYGRKACVQCRYTCAHLDQRGISYEYFDVDEDPLASDTVAHQAQVMHCPPTLPLVIITDSHERVTDKWFGFKIDKIKGLRNG